MQRIKSTQEKFDAYLNLAMAGCLVQNYTEVGYEVVKQPPGVHARLLEPLSAALAKQGYRGVMREAKIDQISGNAAGFVDVGSLGSELLAELKPIHEQWSGQSLVGSNVYGLRLYGEGNSLTMHLDRVSTHVVSSILHVGRDVDEPWPIVIEGFDGRTVEVDLQPGEILFYESAKCIHGRPRPLKGKWYASLFMHYRPTIWNITVDHAVKLVDPAWRGAMQTSAEKVEQDSEGVPELRMRGTGFYEPSCPNEWCGLSGKLPPVVKSGGSGKREL